MTLRSKLIALTITAAAAAATVGGTAAPAQAQCTQVDGVDGCIESYICGPPYRLTEAINDELRRAGFSHQLPPFYCTM